MIAATAWKAAVIALLLILVAAGAGWWLAAHDRDQAQAALVIENGVSDGLRASIREQNKATEALGRATELALARGLAAQQVAASNGKRFDTALQRIAGARATTCVEAMPAVNVLLEAVR